MTGNFAIGDDDYGMSNRVSILKNKRGIESMMGSESESSDDINAPPVI